MVAALLLRATAFARGRGATGPLPHFLKFLRKLTINFSQIITYGIHVIKINAEIQNAFLT